MPQSKYYLSPNVTPLKHSRLLHNGRQANDGRWYVQSTPFPMNLYSAFYDNRTSLEPNTSHIVLIGQFDHNVIDRCLLWFDNGNDARTELYRVVIVPGKIVKAGKHDRVIICTLPANISNGQIPVEVAPAWPDKFAASGFSRTAFRLPVTVPRWSPSRGRLAFCLNSMTGSRWQPKEIVQWLEMQRLLGVEYMTVYNRSLPHERRRVFDEYSHDDVDDQRNLVIELRQSHGDLPFFDGITSHQTPTLNDCYYRNMGLYRHIVVHDVDELIVPRQNFTTIPDLIDNLKAIYNKTFGYFVFRNLHFFFKEPPTVKAEEQVRQLLPLSLRNHSSISTYLTKRRRAAVVSPRGLYVKSVIDTDACIAVGIHICDAFTARFSRHDEQRFDVDPELAMKHHMRWECNIDDWLKYFKMDNCSQTFRKSIDDDMLLVKYGEQLVDRLLKKYDVLNITLLG